MNVSYQSGGMILYVSVWCNNYWIQVCWHLKSDVVKIAQMSLYAVFAFSIQRIKREMIGKNVYKSIFWWEFTIK